MSTYPTRTERLQSTLDDLRTFYELRSSLHDQIESRMVNPHDQETYIQLIGKIQAALRTLADSLDFEAYALDQALFDAEQAGLVYIVPDQDNSE